MAVKANEPGKIVVTWNSQFYGYKATLDLAECVHYHCLSATLC